MSIVYTMYIHIIRSKLTTLLRQIYISFINFIDLLLPILYSFFSMLVGKYLVVSTRYLVVIVPCGRAKNIKIIITIGTYSRVRKIVNEHDNIL